jgi:CrcB protein
MQRFLLICLAGAAGTGVRYLVGLGMTRALGSAFPCGTLLVNLVGCFLISLVAFVALSRTDFSETTRLVLATGFMGGLTTYSSFNYETTRYLQTGETKTAVAYLGATLLGCFVTGLLGLALGRQIVGT